MKKLFMILAMPLLVASCDKIGGHIPPEPTLEETVENKLVEATNPVMTSVDQVMMLQSKLIEARFVDDVLISMPSDMLRNIATVCIRNNGCCSKADIVYEYQSGARIYDNLPMPDEEAKKAPVDDPPAPTVEPKVQIDSVIQAPLQS